MLSCHVQCINACKNWRRRLKKDSAYLFVNRMASGPFSNSARQEITHEKAHTLWKPKHRMERVQRPASKMISQAELSWNAKALTFDSTGKEENPADTSLRPTSFGEEKDIKYSQFSRWTLTDLISEVMTINYLNVDVDLKCERTFSVKESLTTGTVCHKKWLI